MITVNYKLELTNLYNETFITNIRLRMEKAKRYETYVNRIQKVLRKYIDDGTLKSEGEILEITILN